MGPDTSPRPCDEDLSTARKSATKAAIIRKGTATTKKASAARPAVVRSASAKKSAATRKRNAAPKTSA